ncbi:hypothetical protein PYW08_004943 [Mythimna loreyi]|uniref:Uncharacterized protein n=1 Tax=Mythimna loreyi TaxID=667449 RepID=A0ACC2QDL8_9NEOP|nr:hypothetical protein PYW08_004943 [Mythimna loreyi]
MKPTLLVFFVVLLAVTVISVPANHHKRHRGSNVKAEEYSTTFDPSEGDNGDGGDIEWPEMNRIRNVDLPNVFGPGRAESSRIETVPVKHHGKTSHGTHSQ